MPVFSGKSSKTYKTQSSPIASGGEGEIFDIIGMPDYVAKVFRFDKRTTERERKLSVMISVKPNVVEQYAWPSDVIYENGKFAGYIMPKIQGKEKLRDIYVYDKRQGKPWSLYIAVAKNVAAAVHNVHEIHQVIGDLNPENILVNPSDGMVTLVDTDSYHISDSRRTYRCEVGMPEYVAPELQGIHFPSAPLPTYTETTDRFALAVLIFALLMNGAHPFACKIISGSSSKFQPIDNMQKGYCAFFPETCSGNMDIPRYAPSITSLPDGIQKLFKRAFIEGRRDSSVRPSAEEWYNELERLEDNLKTCLKNNQHIYYYGAKDCPWCEVTRKMHSVSQSAFSSSSISGSSSTTQTTSTITPPSPQPQQQQQQQYYAPSSYKYTPTNTNKPQKKKRNGCVTAIIIVAICYGVFYGGYFLLALLAMNFSKQASENSSNSQSSSYVSTTPRSENDATYLGSDLTAYDHGSYYEEYNNSDKTFNLGGIPYNNGFTIGTYPDGGYAIFNINGDYKYFRATVGNVDNVNFSLSYVFYGDGKMIGTIDVEGGALPKNIEFDVSGIKELKIIADGDSNYSEGVGFGNAVVSNSSKSKTDKSEINSSDIVFLGQDIVAYDHGSYYDEYNNSGESFKLGGLSYSRGFCIGTYPDGGYASFNLEGKYLYISGIAGNVDGTQYSLSYIVYGDGKKLGNIDIVSGNLPKQFSFEVKGIKQLKIVADGDSNYSCGVGFANVTLYNDKNYQPITFEEINYTPDSHIGREIKAYQHGGYYDECSEDGNHIDIQGTKYYYGFQIGTYDDGGFANYNLGGKYKTISGKAGFKDDVISVSYVLIGDGKEIGTIDFGSLHTS